MSTFDLSAQVLMLVPRPVWVIDPHGAIAFANEAAAGELGYLEPHQLRGLPSHDTIHHHRPDGSDYPAEECPVLQPAMTGLPAAQEDQYFIRKNGSMFPISWSARPIELPSGRGTVLTFTDVSDEHARRRHREREEWRGFRRTSRDVTMAYLDRNDFFETLCRFVATNVDDPALTPESLARAHHISLRLLQTVFAGSGLSPARYIRERRLVRARELLVNGHPVSAAGRLSGFADAQTFRRAFRRHYGESPSTFVEKLMYRRSVDGL